MAVALESFGLKYIDILRTRPCTWDVRSYVQLLSLVRNYNQGYTFLTGTATDLESA